MYTWTAKFNTLSVIIAKKKKTEINLTKHLHDFYTRKYKILKTKIKALNTGRDMACSWRRFILPNLIPGFTQFRLKSQQYFL